MIKIEYINFRNAIIFIMSIYFSINIFGFCYSDFKFYNNNEIIDRTIEMELKENRGKLLNGIRTLAEFKEIHKNCCKISMSTEKYNWILRFFGAGRWDVYINYIQYKNGKYGGGVAVYTADCCGPIGPPKTDFN